mgnify:CR=1 FL=1
MNSIKPYKTNSGKKKQIIKMFNNIASSYDMLNHTLSLGMDNVWRRFAVKQLTNQPKEILDIATGTGDFAIIASRHTNAKITGIDISQKMLDVGIKKIKKHKLTNRIKLELADSEDLPFNDNSYDAITVGFGVRNFENLNKGISEMYRTLKKGGIITILEPSEPSTFPLKQLYKIYFNYILPFIGGIVSKDKNAYIYLPNSVASFPSGEQFLKELKKGGFENSKHVSLSFGIVSLYIAIK